MTTPAAFENPAGGARFIVASDTMRKFMAMVERVARHVGSVLILGETGTGKEMTAHTIHTLSLRCGKPFVEINCAALPENLVESELFGYEKGAFSGADSAKPGLFELAHGGTIFLDEIGELDLRIQVKLLRILDRAPYYRLGGHRKITTDVRVVAATNRDLKGEVSAGRFRKDLYHRLSQFELCVPPLRERLEDIKALAEHFLEQMGQGLRFSPEALKVLQAYDWPGNVRELQNVVNKVAVLASGPEIGATELRSELIADEPLADEEERGSESTTQLDSLEAQAIKTALQRTGGHRGRAAEQLGISRRTLSRKLRRYGFLTARENAVELGTLSNEQQRHFRTPVWIPVSLQTVAGIDLSCTATNLSAHGMGLEGLPAVLEPKCELRVRFQLPDSDVSLEVRARVAWGGGTHGRAGIAFTEVPPAVHQQISRWLRQKMTEEGWRVKPQEPASLGAVHRKGQAASAGQ